MAKQTKTSKLHASFRPFRDYLITMLPLAALALVYGAADLCFALRGAMSQSEGKLLGAMTLPFLFPAVHIVYGAGTICGLLTPEKGAHHA